MDTDNPITDRMRAIDVGQQLDDATAALIDLEDAIYTLIAVARTRGAQLSTVTAVLRECEAVITARCELNS